jgi:hypothetical protein
MKSRRFRFTEAANGHFISKEDTKSTKKLENFCPNIMSFVVNDSLPNFATFASLREILPDQFDDRPIVL